MREVRNREGESEGEVEGGREEQRRGEIGKRGRETDGGSGTVWEGKRGRGREREAERERG